jgi:hypothetical protein
MGLRQARCRCAAGFSLGQETGRQPLIVAKDQRQFTEAAAEESVAASAVA